MKSMMMLVRSEAKMILREPSDLLIPLGLPLLILVMWGFQTRDAPPIAGDRSVLDVIGLPVAFTTTIALIGIINMPTLLTTYRKTGVLRRLALTPISPLRVLSSQVAVSVAQAVVGIALAFTVGAIAFDAGTPTDLLPALGVIVLTVLAMYSIGMVLASLAPSPSATLACGFVIFLGFGALGGMFGGIDALPEILGTVGSILPFGAAVEALGATWVGAPVDAKNIISLIACSVAGITVSALTFRWTR
ncbi:MULTISPECIES: ABC transporter permease [Auritidibacter]|nr:MULTISPECIES: ABC transporter permease [Auritidibacter]AXR73947.1 ABC transporter permease [Auritidibacter sp. NML130574]PXA78992.1 ABC transporter permease [Auritidibacter sp. NML120779]WGH84459.1 ABC transporter permease [Auritidibacter ignavus]WHS27400.1 ABC transporter permease [Auritidibacter ignavus]